MFSHFTNTSALNAGTTRYAVMRRWPDGTITRIGITVALTKGLADTKARRIWNNPNVWCEEMQPDNDESDKEEEQVA